jgi:uncharacterized protein YcaQ
MQNFQRVYDLPERVLPAEHLLSPCTKQDGQRQLLQKAALAMGVSTLKDLADYYRMSSREAAPRVQELIENGDLSETTVEGWREPAYLAAGVRCPRKIECASLLSPFDPVVWFRSRAERLFNFHYRIEIYVPAEKRRWGYYVLPFLLDGAIVARLDVKADRQTGKLLVLAAHEEPEINRVTCAEKLAVELRSLQGWLDLNDIVVTRHNALSRLLAGALRR